MIELVFGQGTAGAMLHAKATGANLNEIYALSLDLEIGDISFIDTNISNRKKIIEELSDVFYENLPGLSEELWTTNQRTLERLDEAKKSLEPIRIWVCDCDPSEMCGLYYICNFMENSETPIHVVYVPRRIIRNETVLYYRSTGEIHPEMFDDLLKFEDVISKIERNILSEIWKELVKENAPLRVIINGKLIEVTIDFYDDLIRTNILEGEFIIAKLIGKTLIHILGVSDRFIYLRIQEMIKSGELTRISEKTPDYPYSEVLKKS